MEASKRTITFGADPEFLVVNKQGNLVPSWLLGVAGTKKAPSPIPSLENNWGLGMLMDGVAIELNIAPVDKLRRVAERINYAVNSINMGGTFAVKTAKLSYAMTEVDIPIKYRDHPGFTEIGCTVDLDAFRDEDKQVRSPWCAADMGTKRYTGGHIHIGCDPWPEWLPKRAFVQLFAASYSSYIPEPHPQGRDNYYGMPGIWRETQYGVEYRSPTTAWLRKEGPYLEALDKTVRRILTAQDDETIEGLARIYQQGTLSDFRYAFDKKNYGDANRIAHAADTEMSDILAGKRYRVTKPTKLRLEGYRRESENDQVPPQQIGGRDELIAAMEYADEIIARPLRRELLPIFRGYGGNLVANGGAVHTHSIVCIWNWVNEAYPDRVAKYGMIDYLGRIQMGDYADYLQFRMPPARPGVALDPQTVIVVASEEGNLINIREEATGTVLYDILADDRPDGDFPPVPEQDDQWRVLPGDIVEVNNG